MGRGLPDLYVCPGSLRTQHCQTPQAALLPLVPALYISLGRGCQTLASDTPARLAGREMTTFYFQRFSSFLGGREMV